MNGIHDMGGMHGFGRINPEPNEPVFHARWEARVMALFVAMAPFRRQAGISARVEIEKLPPVDYLRMSYYERWLAMFEDVAIRTGLMTREELASGHMAAGSTRSSPPVTADKVQALLATRRSASRPTTTKPRFSRGTVVKARNIHPNGHTRLPRYVRGRVGIIERDHGAHVFPDESIQHLGETSQFLYTVRFAAREVWGDTAHSKDSLYLDLWEEYLELA